ncbi:MAG: cellulase family glycosylhydrolase [Solirubrobacteraceae bacterium]
MISRLLTVLALALAAALATALPASADGTGEVGIEAGEITLSGAQDREAVARGWREMGVDYVRVQAYWDAIAPSPRSRVKPRGFVATNPNRRYNWGQLDRAVDLVVRNGMKVMLTIHQSGPVWASAEPRFNKGSRKPKPAEFGYFARAVATRYGRRVNRYLAGNEANQGLFLSPQTVCARGRCERLGPSMYRELVRAAYTQIKRADRNAQVLIGELAPIGSARPRAASLAPLPFLRGMGCLDDRLRRITTGSCRRFIPAKGDGFGYHPYGVRARPDQPNRDRNLAKIGDLPRLLSTLDAVTTRRRIIAPRNRFNLYLTEFGYETNPPDRRNGVSFTLQSRFLQQAAYIAFLQRRVKLITQYQWRDDAGTARNRSLGFQTGLLTFDNRAKPSLASFPHQFFIDTRRGRLWGQVRPGGGNTVTIERRAAGGSGFAPVAGGVQTNGGGYFWLRAGQVESGLVRGGAAYRYTYTNPLTGQFASSEELTP